MLKGTLRASLHAVLALSLILPALAGADQLDHERGRPGRPGKPGHHRPDLDRDRISARLKIRTRGEEILHVRQLLDLDASYRGRRVRKVILEAESDHGMGRAQLLVNNSAVDSSRIIGIHADEVVFRPDSYHDTLGLDIRTLEIRLNGNITVHSLTVVLAPEQHLPPRPPVPAPRLWSCSISTPAGIFVGVSVDQEAAIADARNRCISAYNNSRVCMRGAVSCRLN